jgi:transposase
LEAIRQQKTINQITAEFGVHATRVNNWKKMATDAIAQAFVGEEG